MKLREKSVELFSIELSGEIRFINKEGLDTFVRGVFGFPGASKAMSFEDIWFLAGKSDFFGGI